ncbi:unnamed protein product [Ranitomeya imitator]|uniref:Glycolipid transfer protein domain-containing protein n=1 Tax=Ranitomeya imitator TaxID=111125 RepID=A0ABN9L247_9NEOB|nr:unnamed protein product [Ranitomeya imitator]
MERRPAAGTGTDELLEKAGDEEKKFPSLPTTFYRRPFTGKREIGGVYRPNIVSARKNLLRIRTKSASCAHSLSVYEKPKSLFFSFCVPKTYYFIHRGLKFIQVLLQSISDGERDEQNPNHIKVNVTKAYEIALKKYHGWVVQKLFQAALCAAPYKDDFLKALSKGQNVKEEECIEKIRQFLVNYTTTIEAIYIMYNKMGAELDYKA